MVRQNNPSREKSNGRYKGVRMRKWGKWVTEVRQPNSRHRIWLGSYRTPEEAARAYDAAMYCLRGPSATLNFPNDPPNIPSLSVLSPPQIQVVASRHAHSVPRGLEEKTSFSKGYSEQDVRSFDNYHGMMKSVW